MPSNVLTFFPVDGFWRSIASANPKGSTAAPQFSVTRAFVDFIPRVPAGWSISVDNLSPDGNPATPGVDTAITIPIITGRIWNGRLSTINVDDTPTVELLAASTALGLTPENLPDTGGKLLYDIRFREVLYNKQVQALTNFAIEAPSIRTPVSLTDDQLVKLPYAPIRNLN